MTMQTSGPISIGQARNECQLGNPVDAGNATLSKLAGVNSGQHYAWSYWYGKSNGFQVVELGTQYFNINYSHAMWANFGYNFYVYQFLDVYTTTGGAFTNGGTFPNYPINGALMNGIMRYNNTLTVYAQNCSLDGMTWTSSLGESLPLTNDHSFSWSIGANLYTIYCAISPISQGTRSYTINLTGSANRPQPPAGYVNGVAPPPPGDGGGGGGGGGGPN